MDPIRAWLQDKENVERLLRAIGQSLARRHWCPHCRHNIEDQAWEVLEEVLVIVLPGAANFQPGRSVTAWLMGFVVRIILNRCRRTHHRRRYISETELGAELDGLTPLRRSIEDGLPDVNLDESLRRLPTRYREVIQLRFFEGLSFQQIASKLGETDGNVRALRGRALKKLAGLLTKPEGSNRHEQKG